MLNTNKLEESNSQNNPQLQYSNYLLSSNSSLVFNTNEINDMSSSSSSISSVKNTPSSILNSNNNCNIQSKFTPNNSLTISITTPSTSTTSTIYSDDYQICSTSEFLQVSQPSVELNQYKMCSSQNNTFYNQSSSNVPSTNNYYDSISSTSRFLFLIKRLCIDLI